VVHDNSTVGGIPQRALLLGMDSDAVLGNQQMVYSAVAIVGANTGDFALFVDQGLIQCSQGIESTDYMKAPRLWLPLETRTYAATMIHNVRGNNYLSSISLTGNLSFSLSNITAGFKCEVRIKSDGSVRNLTFPAGWVFIGSAAPASIAASKTGILELWCLGTTDADVVARWTVQP
jgi:hypothetical protein